MRAVIGGTAKNGAVYFPAVYANIQALATLFDEVRIVVSYDPGRDGMLRVIQQYPDVTILQEAGYKPTPYRTWNIANARNRMLEWIDRECPDFDVFLMLDMDDVSAGPVYPQVLQAVLDRWDDWDICSFNKPRYYDYWALSIGPYTTSCFTFRDHLTCIYSAGAFLLPKLEKPGQFVECWSAFNGVAIYKLDKLKGLRYTGKLNPDLFSLQQVATHETLVGQTAGRGIHMNEDCEHREYQVRAAKERGAKVRIYSETLIAQAEEQPSQKQMLMASSSSSSSSGMDEMWFMPCLIAFVAAFLAFAAWCVLEPHDKRGKLELRRSFWSSRLIEVGPVD